MSPVTKSYRSIDEKKMRADTPDSEGGGYFTLSESETGSNNGTDSKEESASEVTKTQKKNLGVLQKRNRDSQLANRSGSETPPRPSLPREYWKEITPPRPSPPKLTTVDNTNKRKSSVDEPPPPRPPPPLSYTSTLPPPSPKRYRNKLNDFRSKTLPVRRPALHKEKSIQRVPQHYPQSTLDTKQSQDNKQKTMFPNSDECEQSNTTVLASQEKSASDIFMMTCEFVSGEQEQPTLLSNSKTSSPVKNVDRNGIQRSHLTEQQELTDQSMFELLENSTTSSQISLFNSLEAIGGTEAKDVKSTKDYIEFDSNVIDNSQENKLSAIEDSSDLTQDGKEISKQSIKEENKISLQELSSNDRMNSKESLDQQITDNKEKLSRKVQGTFETVEQNNVRDTGKESNKNGEQPSGGQRRKSAHCKNKTKLTLLQITLQNKNSQSTRQVQTCLRNHYRTKIRM